MPIQLEADARSEGKPLTHFWSVCVGAGRANEGLRAGWLEQMKVVVEHCGFQYVRFHGLFHDDMFVYRETDGEAVYNFQYIDDLFDRLLEIGVRPFVEFGFCPKDLASGPETVFWWKGNTAPPKDYLKWSALIRSCAIHWIDRYGLDEVRKWYFEVWNEPNLKDFFHGTRKQYFELYKTTALTLKSVDSLLRVGGPATSNFVPDARFDGEKEDISCHAVVTKAEKLDLLEWRPVWIEPFLAYCSREKLPVDFVSTHPYPTDWPLDGKGRLQKYTRGSEATITDLKLLRKLINNGPYDQAEVHLTEWNSSPSPRDFTHDYLQAATYIAKVNLESTGLVNSLSYWTFTDVFEELGGGDTLFHGGFGLINYHGIVKPAFHAYRFLHALGDEILARVKGGIVTRESSFELFSIITRRRCDRLPRSPRGRDKRRTKFWPWEHRIRLWSKSRGCARTRSWSWRLSTKPMAMRCMPGGKPVRRRAQPGSKRRRSGERPWLFCGKHTPAIKMAYSPGNAPFSLGAWCSSRNSERRFGAQRPAGTSSICVVTWRNRKSQVVRSLWGDRSQPNLKLPLPFQMITFKDQGIPSLLQLQFRLTRSLRRLP